MKYISEEGRIGKLRLKNRLTMAPMGLHLGELNESVVSFMNARIDGGVSLIQINCMPTGELEDSSASMLITRDKAGYLKEICDHAHEADCKISLQIMLGCGRVGGPSAKYGGMPIAASATPWHHYAEMICQEITKEDIEFLKDAFRETLEIGIECGVDAVEMHAYGGYLLDQFLTERWNLRTDEYGGDLDGRMRLLTELIDITHETGGNDFPIIVKFTPDHCMEGEGYRKIDEGIEIAKRLEKLGVDCLHVCAGCYDNWENAMPPVYFQEMTPHIKSAEIIKQNVDIPVMVHGRLGNIAKAESVLAHGYADFIAIGRGLLADPNLPKKAMNGDIKDIRPCISCDEGCIAQVYMGNRCGCAINPFCGFEDERSVKNTDDPKKVLVIGGGPGGCAAALLAKAAGHDVELWEKGTRLGGNALVASMPAYKRDMESLIRYYEYKTEHESVRVRLMKEADIEGIKEYAPDHVIWAAGGIPLRPASIPGIDGMNVITAAEALKNTGIVGDKVAVIGGGLVGCETATHLALMKHDVSIVEMAPAVLPEEMFPQVRACVTKWMDKAGINKLEGCKLLSIKDDRIIVEKDGEQSEVKCDTVVLAMGFRPNLGLIEEISKICPAETIGDSVKLGRIRDAVHGAYEAVSAIN